MATADMFAADSGFYMNFKLLNLEEVFPKIMAEKLEASGKSQRAVSLAGRGAAVIAGNAKFAQVFANKIADKLCEAMPEKLKEMGIEFLIEKVFADARGFVVIRAEIASIDLEVLLESMKGTKMSAELTSVLRPVLGISRWFCDVDAKVRPIVQTKMMAAMEEKIPAALDEKIGLELMMINKPSAEQADFFFGAVSSHRCDVILTGADVAVVGPKLLETRVEEQKRGRLLAKAAGFVASHARSPQQIYSKRAPGVFLHCLEAWLSKRGIVCETAETFVAKDGGGKVILRTAISDVDLPMLIRTQRGHPVLAGMAEDQQFLRLGHDGRRRIYGMLRELVAVEFGVCLAEQLEVQGIETSVTDALAINVTAMDDADAHSEDEAPGAS